jgi:hypothetical protein
MTIIPPKTAMQARCVLMIMGYVSPDSRMKDMKPVL